jgi:1,4-alpha-glucan branching enzyme
VRPAHLDSGAASNYIRSVQLCNPVRSFPVLHPACLAAARRSPFPAFLLLALAPASLLAAAPDDNVEWNGVSHVAWQDRRPLCPVSNEPFEVRFQTYRDDLTAARVRLDDGGNVSWITASPVAPRGPYDVWSASLPATAAGAPSYVIELTDGTDVDWYSVSGMSDGMPTDGGFILDFATLGHAPLGATPATGGTVFKVWAPTRTTVHVRGEFNGWGLASPLAKTGPYFAGFVPGASNRQMYKYFFNNSVWNSDARARSLDPSNNYNARIEDPFGYTWISGDFPTPPLDQLVLYQLHVGTFAGRNDPLGSVPFPSGFDDVAARVGHLQALGVNAVLLNPINEFPGDESAGYNPVSDWAPEWIYGTPDDFKHLVDVFHQHGIAVLLDIVWNHFSFTDNYLWNYDGSQIYFDTPAVATPWGDQADFDEAEVADYFADSALLWLEEYRVDGFRMDATDYMNQPPQDAAGWALMQRLNDEVDNRFVDKATIAEQLPDDSWVTRPTSLGGAGFDSQYHDAFTDQLRQEILDSAFGSPEMWRIQNIVNGSGANLSGVQVTNYLELHDEAWPESGGQRIVKTIDTTFPHDDPYARGRVKLGQGLVMTAPGVPAILQGTEWLEDTDFGTSVAERIDWSKKTTYADVFAYFQDLIALRRDAPAFRAGSACQVVHVNEAGDVIAFQRSGPLGRAYLVVANFSGTDYASYRVGLPPLTTGGWVEVLNSQAPAYGGPGPENPGLLPREAVPSDGFAESVVLSVPRLGLVVLSDDTGALAAPVLPGDDADEPALRFANPVAAETELSFVTARPGPVRLDVVDARGRLVATLVDGTRAAGMHRVAWNGTDRGGARVAAGVYLVRLTADGATVTRKLTFLR